MFTTTLTALSLAILATTNPTTVVKTSHQTAKPSIVLVHGAFADAAGWAPVITRLEKDGYHVTAVENPLQSLDGDIATTKRVIEAQKGPVVLVGHSYGGAVISGAGVNEPNVKSLVYVAAYVPEANESLVKLSEPFPVTPLFKALQPDAAGFFYIDRSQFHAVFCADVPDELARVMAATQKPLQQSTFTATLPEVAWKTLPSYFILPTEDQGIAPDLMRFAAKRAKAKITELKSSHVAFISHPDAVVKVIEEAAKASN